MTIWRFDAIGTLWEIETSHELGADDRERVGAEIERFDREWSRFREDSSVTRVGREGGSISSPDAGAMLDAYRDLSRASSGAVNPLVAESLDALGYDASYSLVASSPIAAPGRLDRSGALDGGGGHGIRAGSSRRRGTRQRASGRSRGRGARRRAR